MRHAIPVAILLAIPLSASAADPKVEEFAPHATGVALVQVVKIEKYDERSTDGNKGLRFKLKRVRGTGEFRDTIDVVTEFGGFRGGEVPKPSAPVKVDSLKKGERWWFAFATNWEYEKHNQGVIGFWPEKDAKAATFEAAIKADAYKWHPQYHPELKLTYGRLIEKDKWRVRVEKQGKTLWEKEFPGKPASDLYPYSLYQGTGELNLKMPKCGHILMAETSTRLEKDNEFGLPAGPYHVGTGFDPETGKRHGVWARPLPEGPNVPRVNREYDPDTDKPKREQRFDVPLTGGKAVGAKTEDWYRMIARTFDATGKVTKEETFRHDQDADPDKRWVKVK
jgi:hypothetical protein